MSSASTFFSSGSPERGLLAGASCAALLAFCAGCTAPDLSPQIAQAQALVAATSEQTEPSLSAAAAEDLRVAERAAAERREVFVDLPTGCVARLATDLSNDVSDCQMRSFALPDDETVNAVQVQQALAAIDQYFVVLLDLATTDAPADIRAKADLLVAALEGSAGTRSTASLQQLAQAAGQRGPAVAASAGFLAERARVMALRRAMKEADGLIDELVRGMQPVLLRLGDPAADARGGVVAARGAYFAAQENGTVDQQVAAAARYRAAVDAMHKSEAQSAIRRLYLVRDLHAAMLRRLTGTPSLAEIESLVAQIAEIKTLLEAS